MDLKIIYQDDDVMVIDKPAGIIVFNEGVNSLTSKLLEDSLIDQLIKLEPDLKNVGQAPRYGAVHRLDKDTSGLLLVARTFEALTFLQQQFSAHTFSALEKSRKDTDQLTKMGKKNGQTLENTIEKRYIALVTGNVKDDKGIVHTFMTRSKSDPRKQKASWLQDAKPEGKREAITEYKVIQRFIATSKSGEPRLNGRAEYTLLSVAIKTGRKHQIRCHLAYIHHPIAGDYIYGFKDSPKPAGLERQFLHASYLKIQLPSGQEKEFQSDLPEDLQKIVNNLEIL